MTPTVQTLKRKSVVLAPTSSTHTTLDSLPTHTIVTAPIIVPTSIKKVENKPSPLPISLNDFNLLQVLGKGCMGKVYIFIYILLTDKHYGYVLINIYFLLGSTCKIQKKSKIICIKID